MRQYVGVIIVREDGAVVAQHRDDKPGILGRDTWAVPGGAVEEGETVGFAAFREYEEETGYTPYFLGAIRRETENRNKRGPGN